MGNKMIQKIDTPQHFSAIGFKQPSADLRRISRNIFPVSLAVSLALTAFIITRSFTYEKAEKTETPPPVVLLVENIPQTINRVVTQSAPSTPYRTAAEPVPVDDILPDEVTIEDTRLDPSAVPDIPVMAGIAGDAVREEENRVFESFAVEEPPERTSSVVPEYPSIAARAGIGGTVTLKVLVNATGAIDSIAVLDGPDILRAAAVDAARATTFKPARHNNRAVSCWVILPFRFTVPR
jgi:TonB family protein